MGALLRDLALLGGLSTVLGLLNLWRAGMPVIGEEPPAAACDTEENGGVELAEAPLERIPATDAIAEGGQPGVTFIDTRPPEQYRAGHVPGAVNLPDAARIRLTELGIGPEDRVITYCDDDDPARADQVGSAVRERAGCRDVLVLDGGWSAWVGARGPTERIDG